MLKNALAMLVVGLLVPAPGTAVNIILPMDGDANVHEKNPDINYDHGRDGDDLLWMSNGTDDGTNAVSNYNNRVAMHFDTSALGGTSADVLSATLNLYAVYSTGIGDTRLGYAKVGTAWDETTVTWLSTASNRDWYGDTASTVSSPDTTGWHSYDATDIVTNWMDGAYPDGYLYMRQASYHVWVRQWEGYAAGDGHAGYIAVEYIPEPATMGLLCVGGVALLKRRRR